MTKDETIQKLLDQINYTNETYITIITIVLVLVSIAFGILTWLQLRLNKNQYNTMKEEAKRELVETYKLDSMLTLLKSNDQSIKNIIGNLTFKYVTSLQGKSNMSHEDQLYLANKLEEVFNQIKAVIDTEDRKNIKELVRTLSNAILNEQSFKLDASVQKRIEKVYEETS